MQPITLEPEQLAWGKDFATYQEAAKVLSILGNSPRSLETGIVDVEVRPVPVAIKPKGTATADLGMISRLPNEVVDMIINKLDLPSAISLSYVNRIANHYVQKSAVSLLRQWAPGLPKILMNIQSLKIWSIHDLKEAIIREKCVMCGNSTVQLYLPTMERICHPCVHNNHAYWCLPLERAAMIFGLDLPDLIGPETVFLPRLGKDEDDMDLGDLGAWVIPVKVALTRALEIHGSRKAIKRAAEGLFGSDDDEANEYDEDGSDDEFTVVNQHDIYRAVSLDTPNAVKMRFLISLGNCNLHAFHHEVSCRVPVVNRNNTRKILYACRGCTAMLTHPQMETISNTHMEMMQLDPALDKYERSFEIFRRAFHVRTMAEMVEHVRTECIGGWFLLHAEGQNM
ncbi:hypothetical protein DTO027I6_8135 [Penicillium roqueforti]|nr:hypothetical protein CBS147337_6232 [Penicillium roqueforti]KAI2675973.1 hypothetical protein CBS147355_6154 [Penicillium roqueforti]KAI2679340.1 hypothetical protein LCP963914a_7439 [Penicillium roqueforti]KAI3171433.1 hypothetical protein CBS147317_862 [Penicillium roqueforti]KAI3192247.1 hypothetical protein DTO027I6_8135 [Penicillium roqueforti]